MDENTAQQIFVTAFGVEPEDPNAQELIDHELINNTDVLSKALGKSPDQYIEDIALIWEAIYVLGLRQHPVRVS